MTEPFIKHWAKHYGIDFLPIRLEHLFRLRQLPMHHRDPFDRLLVAQAEVEMLPLVTADKQLKDYHIKLVGL